MSYMDKQVFDPFRAIKMRGRLSGPVPKGARCARCEGPRMLKATLCRGCVQAEAATQFAAVSGYWRRLEDRQEPDFAPWLINAIHEREMQIGPAAFWPKAETITK